MGWIEFQDITGFRFESIEMENPTGNAVIFIRCKDISGQRIAVTNPIPTNVSCALGLIPAQKFTLARYYFRNKHPSDGRLLEVGGGSATGDISKDIRIERIVLGPLASGMAPKIVIQGGPYRPAGLLLQFDTGRTRLSIKLLV